MRFSGVRLHHRAVRIWRWSTRSRHVRSHFFTSSIHSSVITKVMNCLRSLTRGTTHLTNEALPLLSSSTSPPPPKGHLAVYVGQSPSPSQRYVVPLVYVTHPLFEELLQEAAEEFGYHHDGGISIPCGVDRFERVKTRIAQAGDGRRLRCCATAVL